MRYKLMINPISIILNTINILDINLCIGTYTQSTSKNIPRNIYTLLVSTKMIYVQDLVQKVGEA